ncbi:MAG TPA: choice-of-anchor C family protein [Candidatus Eisenbacteria bacterium]|nr:choice-of-anchor C family protein [Candidatus Eisenbacteria bacterium]
MHPSLARTMRSLTVAMMLMAGASAATADVTNGSYETGPPNPSGIVVLPSGSTAITGWLVSRGTIEHVSDVVWQPANGTRTVALNGSGPGGISQTIATAPGAEYSVSLMMAGEPFTPPTIKNLRVLAAGQSGDFSFDASAAWHWAMGWQQRTWNFTASANPTTIEFMSLDAGEYSPIIDNVQVQLVSASVGFPESGELWLGPAHPNPSRGPMSVDFQLPRADRVSLRVLDLSGRELTRVADTWFAAGPHTLPWDARRGLAANGARSGVYFLELRTSAGRVSRRFSLVF